MASFLLVTFQILLRLSFILEILARPIHYSFQQQLKRPQNRAALGVDPMIRKGSEKGGGIAADAVNNF